MPGPCIWGALTSQSTPAPARPTGPGSAGRDKEPRVLNLHGEQQESAARIGSLVVLRAPHGRRQPQQSEVDVRARQELAAAVTAKHTKDGRLSEKVRREGVEQAAAVEVRDRPDARIGGAQVLDGSRKGGPDLGLLERMDSKGQEGQERTCEGG